MTEPGSQRKADLYASLNAAAWYVVCADREYRARDGLLDLHLGEVWLPECRIAVSRRRTRVVQDGPLFPGYLFVRGVLTDDWLAAVQSVRDVVDLLPMQSQPRPACDRQMAKLRQLVAEQGGRILIEAGQVKRGYGHVDEPVFEPEQTVRVIEGPFTGFHALVKAVAAEDRIKIMLDIFGRPTETVIDEASVEAVA